MKKYENRTQSTCFSQLRRKGSLPLMSIKNSLDIYKNVSDKNPLYGMDVYAKDFIAKDFVLLQSGGEKIQTIPICCSHYILILNIKGKSLRHVNQYSYEAKEHSLQLLVPGTIYSFEDINKESESLMIFFEYELFDSSNQNFLEFFSRKFEPEVLNEDIYSQVLNLFKLLNQEYKDKKLDYKEYSNTLLVQILYLLKREKSLVKKEKICTRSQQISRQFLTLIEENFQRKKSVQEYARILDISPKHLSETIKENLKESALFLIHLRVIKEIQYQLCYTSLSIKEISSSLYFANTSDFGRFFKRYKELSPKTYRLKFQA
ncbi:MAG: hypothetical protein COA66_14995 [Arcobacter sp.]|nr:MAG: hypothetical protein COA66_14995 [Arcobacter sp.]